MSSRFIFNASLAAIALLAAGQPVHADAEFDACVRKLCVNTEQGDCWIKAGAELCNKSGSSCSELEDHAPAKVLSKKAKRWEMEIKSGRIWVNERWMMVSGDKC